MVLPESVAHLAPDHKHPDPAHHEHPHEHHHELKEQDHTQMKLLERLNQQKSLLKHHNMNHQLTPPHKSRKVKKDKTGTGEKQDQKEKDIKKEADQIIDHLLQHPTAAPVY